jgi:hypothetical protein
VLKQTELDKVYELAPEAVEEEKEEVKLAEDPAMRAETPEKEDLNLNKYRLLKK